MTFSDHLDLRTAVIEAVEDERIVDVFPRLVSLAENQIFRDLRLTEQIQEDVVTFVDGRAPLPSNFQKIISLYSRPRHPMTLVPLTVERTSYSPYSQYAVSGNDLIITNGDGDRDLVYYAKPCEISCSLTATNSTMQTYPSVYLNAVITEAFKHLKRADEYRFFKDLYTESMLEARSDSNRRSLGDARVTFSGYTP